MNGTLKHDANITWNAVTVHVLIFVLFFVGVRVPQHAASIDSDARFLCCQGCTS